MEDIHRTHKEPAWGWIGALFSARPLSAPPATAKPGDARSRARPCPTPPRRAAC